MSTWPFLSIMCKSKAYQWFDVILQKSKLKSLVCVKCCIRSRPAQWTVSLWGDLPLRWTFLSSSPPQCRYWPLHWPCKQQRRKEQWKKPLTFIPIESGLHTHWPQGGSTRELKKSSGSQSLLKIIKITLEKGWKNKETKWIWSYEKAGKQWNEKEQTYSI